jgi:hypothetical protein
MMRRLVLLTVLVLVGCGVPTPPPAPAIVVKPVSTEPGEVELSEAVVTFLEPNQAKFEVKYRFTKGQPDKYYLLELRFPGTKNHASKTMEMWELKPNGVIRDTAFLHHGKAEKFELKLSEASSPMAGLRILNEVVPATRTAPCLHSRYTISIRPVESSSTRCL